MNNLIKLKVDPIAQIALIAFLSYLIAVGALPGYLTGHWSWAEPPAIPNLKQIKAIREQGIQVPGWQTVSHRQMQISKHTWLVQKVERDQQHAILLLLPQNGPKDQPHVEWVDLDGVYRWEIEEEQRRQILVSESTQKPISLDVRYLETWTQRQTYAVIQWYAWPTGGHPAPSHWFWADRQAQLAGDRMPWIAVSIVIPMEPFKNLSDYQAMADALSQSVQLALMTDGFNSSQARITPKIHFTPERVNLDKTGESKRSFC